jgi:hypothetical protein
MPNNDFFDTTDVYEAAYLVSRRQQYRGASFDGRFVSFRFAPSDSLHDLRLDFVNGAEVPARRFCENLRFIQSELKKAKALTRDTAPAVVGGGVR